MSTRTSPLEVIVVIRAVVKVILVVEIVVPKMSIIRLGFLVFP